MPVIRVRVPALQVGNRAGVQSGPTHGGGGATPQTLGTPPRPHASGAVQVPQLAVRPPHPLSTCPQFAVPQPVGTHVEAALPQRPGTPPPPHVRPPPHVPQLIDPPQPLLIVPQLKPAGQAVSGVHGAGTLSPVIEVMVMPPLLGLYVALVEFIGVRSPGLGLSVVT